MCRNRKDGISWLKTHVSLENKRQKKKSFHGSLLSTLTISAWYHADFSNRHLPYSAPNQFPAHEQAHKQPHAHQRWLTQKEVVVLPVVGHALLALLGNHDWHGLAHNKQGINAHVWVFLHLWAGKWYLDEASVSKHCSVCNIIQQKWAFEKEIVMVFLKKSCRFLWS